MMRKRMLIFGLLLAWPGCSESPDNSAVVLDPGAVTQNNRGVGLMGHFQYQEAYDTFLPLVERYPENPDLRVNLAISQLNLQTEADELGALDHLEYVLRTSPDHLRALYVSGILKTYRGETEASLERFRAVAEADPTDAFAAYYTGQGLAQLGQNDEAMEWFVRSLAQDPYLRSAAYGASQAARRLGRPDADDYLDVFQRLADNPRGQLAEIKYTRMGPKANAVVLGEAPPPAPPDDAALWGTFTSLASLPGAELPGASSVTACDIDLDGRVDLMIAGISTSNEASSLVLWNREDGWVPDFTIAPFQQSAIETTLWGDIDGNGWPDVYLCRDGQNQLWMQDDGSWVRDESIQLADREKFRTVDGALFDADHDGDLDIFAVNADGPNVLVNNNRDGTWQIVGPEQGLPNPNRRSRQVLVADLDHDRDLDLVVINETPPHEVYQNDRLWRYEPAVDFSEFCETPIRAAVAGDLDADGSVELVTVDPSGGLKRWAADAAWTPRQLQVPSAEAASGRESGPPGEFGSHLAMIDVAGNGQLDLVYSQGDVITVATLDGTAMVPKDRFTRPGLRDWTPVVIHPRRGFSLVSIAHPPHGTNEPEAVLIGAEPPGPGRFPFLAVSFTGKHDQGQSMRSNASGIGTSYAARSGKRWTMGQVLRDDAGPGQSLQPALIGLGPAPRMDFLAINWSDGVFQTELALEGNVVIEETQRQLSSCPVLFVETSAGMTFVSDLLGVGGIGFRTARDTVVEPRPWERFIFPEGLIAEDPRRIRMVIAEPMEESCYLDAVGLVCWDLPPGWSMTLDERMGTAAPVPTGAPVFFQERRWPLEAVNWSGEVTEAVTQRDLSAAPIPPRDPHFLGRLASTHDLTLHFAEPLETLEGVPTLVLDGWVEYPYSQTCFAAWQANATYDPPTIEARAPSGEWIVVAARVGYPAGMPRQMSIPLSSLPAGTRDLRIRSNLEIYWDSASVVGARPCPQATAERLIRRRSTLVDAGYPKRQNGPQRQPNFDWNNRVPLWDTRFQRGYYTRRGQVDKLLDQADGAVAIFGPGEAVEIEFAGPRPVAPDTRRFYVLEIEGWCKDKDMFTQDGDTLEPLPGQPDEEADRLNESFNTRWMGGS